jgi:hypothetical protein
MKSLETYSYQKGFSESGILFMCTYHILLKIE